jgi:outer membrane protein assembly factor BamB
MKRHVVIAALVVFCLGLVGLGEENWPQFRGPTGQGISDGKHVPMKWSPTQNVRWRTSIHGKAWSSPVIWGDRVWLTSATEDGRELFVVCVDKNSGKILIDQKLFDVEHPQYCIPFNSYASPTPAVEAGRVYVTFGSPGTACLDPATGKVIWQRRDFVCNHFRGAGASICLWKDLLFLPFDGSDHQYIVALDKHNGQTVWKTDRSIDFKDIQPNGHPIGEGDMRKAFSTPRVADFGQGPILISGGSKCLYAYEPTTGKEIWRMEYRKGHSMSVTPLIGKDMIYFGTGHGSPPELWALRPGGHGVLDDSQVAWKVKRAVPTRASPLLLDGLIYMVNDSGVVNCIDAVTGADVWHARIDGTFSAAPIAVAGRIYFFSEDGPTTVLAAGREFRILATNHLDAGCMATAAVSDDALFVRTRTSLYRIQEDATADARQ